MKRALLMALLFGAGTGVGAAAHRGQSTGATRPLVKSSRPMAAMPSTGGENAAPPASPLIVSLDATSVSKTSAGEAVHLALDVGSRFEHAARVRYGFELVTDTGVSVHEPKLSEVFALGTAKERSFQIDTPALSDGFYIARVTVVGDDGANQGSTIRQVYLESRGGSVSLIDSADFHARSRSKEGHR